MAGCLSHILCNNQGTPERVVEIVGLERHASNSWNLLQEGDDYAPLYVMSAA